uniref:Uncharacterized protein n=1 Tax=Arundo donax TaxID=35708 RepID=A0A0A9AY63_ARUDO
MEFENILCQRQHRTASFDKIGLQFKALSLHLVLSWHP